MNSRAYNRIVQARTTLVLDQPFFGILSLRLELVEDDSVGTAATDGRRLIYSPTWVATLSDRDLLAVVAHEVVHCALGHVWRAQGRDAATWNIAADYATNHLLDDAKVQMPSHALRNPELGPLAVEEIYRRLEQATKPQEQEQEQEAQAQEQEDESQDDDQSEGGQDQDDAQDDQTDAQGDDQGQDDSEDGSEGDEAQDGDQDAEGDSSEGDGQEQDGDAQDGTGDQTDNQLSDDAQGQGQGQGSPSPDPGQMGGVIDGPADEVDGQNLENDWKVATIQAAQLAQAQGACPGGIWKLVESLTSTELDWTTILADFVQRTAKNDYSLSRPNRRYLQAGIIVPGMVANELGDVAVVVDTSGSCCAAAAKFLASASDVLAAYPATVHLYACDTSAAKLGEFTNYDLPIPADVIREMPYGGGTSFRPPFDLIDAEGLAPKCLIYLTDCYGTYPEVEPDYPVLWVSISKLADLAEYWRPPFGEFVYMPL